MGGSWYTRASGDSLFEIPKPLRTLGIGVDSLPESARNSTILTGNELGRLGNSEVMPAFEEQERLAAEEKWAALAGIEDAHRSVSNYLTAQENEKALALLFWAAKNH